jgi:Flp pilus assembly protein TadD
MTNPADSGPREPNLREMPFSKLIGRCASLAGMRRHYASRGREQRRAAAQWAYDASFADSMFNSALARTGQESPFHENWPPGVEALAIDPDFAPARLSVGSMEFQLGRREEAMTLFHSLLNLPGETPDLEEIIDKAGQFLLDEGAFEEARELYEAACAVFAASTSLLDGWAYSLAKLGRCQEAVSGQRRALALDPDNPALLNDLGWALTENGDFEEAEKALRKATALAPDDDRARNNLNHLLKIMKRSKGTS